MVPATKPTHPAHRSLPVQNRPLISELFFWDSHVYKTSWLTSFMQRVVLERQAIESRIRNTNHTIHWPHQTPPKMAQQEDRRNLDWKSNNVGSKLLAKMGWKDGQGVGKRYREETTISTQGIRVKRRCHHLGLGATPAAATSSGNHHAADFAKALAEFQQLHGSSSGGGSGGDAETNTEQDLSKRSRKNKKKKKKKKEMDQKDKKKNEIKEPILPTNKVTHSGIRKAKFQAKSTDDLKCIFAGSHEAVYAAPTKAMH
jgi:G-patch domain